MLQKAITDAVNFYEGDKAQPPTAKELGNHAVTEYMVKNVGYIQLSYFNMYLSNSLFRRGMLVRREASTRGNQMAQKKLRR
jgi:hypothetical protein